MQGYARDVATRLSGKIAELEPFELITRDDEPFFAFTVKDKIDNFTVFDVSNACRRGCNSPHTRSRRTGKISALRVVVRRGFSHDLADMLLADIKRQLPRLEKQREPVHDSDSAAAFHH